MSRARLSSASPNDVFVAARDRALDAVYLDLHGAMVSEHYEDGEGELLRRVRDIVGPSVPVVISLDLHANVTEGMLEHCDAMTIYRTYPHLDMAVTGARAYDLLLPLLQGRRCTRRCARFRSCCR